MGSVEARTSYQRTLLATMMAPSLLSYTAPAPVVVFGRGLDVTCTRHLTLMLIAAGAFTIITAVPAHGQIGYPFPPYGYPNVHPDASVRLEVTPHDAEVYVDGYYAGVVNDFDGMLQRLRVEPGQHEITIYHDGYRALHQRVYLTRDRTFKVKQQMEKLGAGEVAESRPVPPPAAAGTEPPVRTLPRNGRQGPPNVPPSNGPSSGARPEPATGRLTIQVQPADAAVLIDGQPWQSSQGQDTVVVDLSEGRHVIQVRKAGYVGYLTEIDVRRGQDTPLNITLRAQP